MNKENHPIFAMLVSWASFFASLAAYAQVVISVLAGLASLIASVYAIWIARERLKKLKEQEASDEE